MLDWEAISHLVSENEFEIWLELLNKRAHTKLREDEGV